MSKKKDTQKERDFESERKNLLATMEKHISTDTKSRIGAAVNSAVKLAEYKITVSHEGASDANNQRNPD